MLKIEILMQEEHGTLKREGGGGRVLFSGGLMGVFWTMGAGNGNGISETICGHALRSDCG